MGKSDKLLAYGIGIFALSAVVLMWISHSGHAGHKAEPPKDVGIPWTGSSPSQAATPMSQNSPSQTNVPSNDRSEEQHSSAEPDARPVYQPSHPQADVPPANQSLPP